MVDGKVTRGYLGVLIQPVTEDLAREFKLGDTSGALVGEVTRNSPAAGAGLLEGDVITEFNGKKITSSQQLRLMASQTAPGTKVKVKFVRDGAEKDLEVKLGAHPTEGLAREGGNRPDANGDLLDGVTVDDLTLQMRRQFSIPNSLEGALVTRVVPDSPSGRAGLQPGDVIVGINRQPVGNAEQAVEASKNLRNGRVLLRVWSRWVVRFIVVSRK